MQPGWTSYLISAYYPLLMTCASLVVCLWAEVSFFFILIYDSDRRQSICDCKWFCFCIKTKIQEIIIRYGLFKYFFFVLFEIFTRLYTVIALWLIHYC